MSAEARVHLRILGPFAACAGPDGLQPIDITSPRHRALLAFLALQPDGSEARERLTALLWEDGSDSQARRRFRQSLLRLRREFAAAGGEVLIGDRDRLALDFAVVSVDARQFLDRAEAGTEADLDAAADLYRGELLDGVHLDNDVFDDWLRRARFRLREVAARIFEACARARESCGENDRAVAAAEQLVALDPSDEAAQRLLIGMLGRLRGRTAALAQADILRDYMRTEFGSGLEAETEQLIASLDTVAPPLSPARPTDREKPRAEAIDASGRATANPAPASADRADCGAVLDAAPVDMILEQPAIWRRFAAVAATILTVAALFYVQRQWLADHAKIASHEPSALQPWQPPPPVRPAAAVSRAVEGRGISALLVLPLAGVPSDSEPTGRISEMITDDLIGNLSRVPSLRIIAKTTSLTYARKAVDVASIGAELGVKYVVEGDIRLAENKLRANIALIDTETRLQVWSGRYERDEADRLKVQDEIANALARQLQVGVMESRARQTDPSLDTTLAKGWAALNQFAFFRGGKDAGALFESVLAKDPDNVSALTGLGAFKSVAANTRQGGEDRETLLRASEALLKRAAEIDPQSSLPPFFLGRLAMWRGQREEALDRFARAVELNPSLAPAYGSIGYVLLHTVRQREALDNLLYAIRLSPNDHYMGLWSAHLGRAYLELGDLDAAGKWLTQSVALMPKSALNVAALAAYYSYRGDDAAAAEQIVKVRKLESSGPLDDLIARFTVLCRDEAERPKHLIAGLQKAMASQ